MFRKLLTKFKNYLVLVTMPNLTEMVSSLIRNTASLEISKGEYVDFAPTPGVCGVIKLSGNSLPIFEYLVFDKYAPMEFVSVRVEISKPDRIQFISHIRSTDPVFDGKLVDTKPQFKTPFFVLANSLYVYFPFTRAKQFVIPSSIQKDPNAERREVTHVLQ